MERKRWLRIQESKWRFVRNQEKGFECGENSLFYPMGYNGESPHNFIAFGVEVPRENTTSGVLRVIAHTTGDDGDALNDDVNHVWLLENIKYRQTRQAQELDMEWSKIPEYVVWRELSAPKQTHNIIYDYE